MDAEVDCKNTLLIALLADKGDALRGKSQVGESLTVATCSVVEVLAASVFNAPDSEMDSVLLSSDLGTRARMDGGVATSKSRDGCTLDETNGSLKELDTIFWARLSP